MHGCLTVTSLVYYLGAKLGPSRAIAMWNIDDQTHDMYLQDGVQ